MVTVLEYKNAPTKHRIGVLSVLTEDKKFILNCELVMWKKENPHLWIRMPEIWREGKKEMLVVATPAYHQECQKTILEQLETKFGMTFDMCKKISRDSMRQHMKAHFKSKQVAGQNLSL